MSWSVSIPATSHQTFFEVVNALTLPEGQSSPEAEEQLEAAKAAAKTLVHSGALGPVGSGYYGGSLGGHANPGHQPTPGWTNDSIYVNLYQASAPPTE